MNTTTYKKVSRAARFIAASCGFTPRQAAKLARTLFVLSMKIEPGEVERQYHRAREVPQSSYKIIRALLGPEVDREHAAIYPTKRTRKRKAGCTPLNNSAG